MKKALVCAMLLILAMPAIGVAIWRYSMSQPSYVWGVVSNESLWNRTMTMVERKTFWPHATRYRLVWNGMSIEDANDVKVASTEWLDVILWNGQGIREVRVYGVTTGKLLYPRKENPAEIKHEGVSISRSGGPRDFKPGIKYLIIAVVPPEKETAVRVVVVDIYGNVTQAKDELSSATKLP